ncbi:Dyp-type peroxidase [Nocardiopsis ansamitocini]|uniref:Dye decolorizing peroxidase n=1 Tax=Nocardiopsis ansamitocini TaxID=1670832 RepID=A0A9W6P4L5_9ACTN|nr:Dyp-type peroxidase [Nocardiopsis ansamitocini]GLU46986.1 hypothetical protein Nans01_13370 [Nocardiopsis ansamitocini]
MAKNEQTPGGTPSRRGFLTGMGAAGLSGVGIGMGAAEILRPLVPERTGSRDAARLHPADARGETHASLQPGIAGAAPAFIHVIALDLVPGLRAGGGQARAAAAGILRSWTDMAARLHEQGPSGPVAAGLRPSSLMVTVGLGASLLDVIGAGGRRPAAFADLPAFGTDVLRAEWSDGDLLLQVGAEDPLVVAAAVNELVDATASAARVRWSVRGFQRTAAAAEDPAGTPRNLMGQIDGTANPPRDHALFERTVVARSDQTPGHVWMSGGSYLVVRRIRMLLAEWAETDVAGRERVIGRRLSTGAPLGKDLVTDTVPLSARDASGEPVIAANAHVRLSSPQNNLGARMFRRGYSYDEGWRPDGSRESGLLFLAWQSDPATGFTPVQRTLDEKGDALNRFVRHEGSALFAVPPAAGEGRYLAQELIEE